MAEFKPQGYLRHISLDCVVFGFHENQMKVLLLRMKYTKQWALPGGFMKEDESLEEAAARTLFQRTGLKDIFLRQFHVFSNPDRSKFNPAVRDLREADGGSDVEWFSQRFISAGFYALVDFEKVYPQPDFFSDRCEWKTLEETGELMMDHNEILQKALEALRLQLSYQPIGFNLMPEKFTMPELQKLYEALLGCSLDRRNFQRKILSYGILNRLKERKTGAPSKAPFLYEFNLENYNKALREGFNNTW